MRRLASPLLHGRDLDHSDDFPGVHHRTVHHCWVPPVLGECACPTGGDVTFRRPVPLPFRDCRNEGRANLMQRKELLRLTNILQFSWEPRFGKLARPKCGRHRLNGSSGPLFPLREFQSVHRRLFLEGRIEKRNERASRSCRARLTYEMATLDRAD